MVDDVRSLEKLLFGLLPLLEPGSRRVSVWSASGEQRQRGSP